MGEIRHQQQVHHLREHQHHDRYAYRGAGVLVGIETWGQYLDSDQSQQTHAIAGQGQAGLPHIMRGKCTVVVKHRHQWPGKHQQSDAARQGQHPHQAQAPVQHGAVALTVTGRLGRCQLRHQHHTQGHAQQRNRELHQPVSVADPTDTARGQVRSNLGVDHQGQLRHTHA